MAITKKVAARSGKKTQNAQRKDRYKKMSSEGEVGKREKTRDQRQRQHKGAKFSAAQTQASTSFCFGSELREPYSPPYSNYANSLGFGYGGNYGLGSYRGY